MARLPRRQFLARSGVVIAALQQLCEGAVVDAAGDQSGARCVGVVPLGRLDGRPQPTPGVAYGTGLDARRFTDLTRLDDAPITPTDRFFVRTAAPRSLDSSSWRVAIDGHVRRPLVVPLDELRVDGRDQGVHLIECAGNTDPANFGLMSAAAWRGVPLAGVVDRIVPRSGPWRVRVTGLDEDRPSRSSVAGASWVFSRDDIERAGALLATEINGSALPRDHGAPVRLVVPGWYGCASIKWVTHIELVPDDAPATSQMREFAARTHQDGTPAMAREFIPAVVDVAATPIRLEQWVRDGRRFYRVIGIVWGGAVPARALQIRFKHTEAFVPVGHYAPPSSTATWSLWSHTWTPPGPGRYQIVLRAEDPTVRTRRLDAYFYTREVEVD